MTIDDDDNDKNNNLKNNNNNNHNNNKYNNYINYNSNEHITVITRMVLEIMANLWLIPWFVLLLYKFQIKF